MSDREESIQSLAIIGGGPASSTLATVLSRAGVDVGVYHEPTEDSILVGESLVPGVIPILRDLGAEEQIQSCARRKPGATINLPDGTCLEFVFEDIPGPHPDYAYNVLRQPFNDTLREVAADNGATYFRNRAGIEADAGTDRVSLTGRSKEQFQSTFGEEPDLVVDATGRARLFAEKLDLPDRRGSRSDTALFTHLEGVNVEDGHIHTDVFDHGWTWRIPLPGRGSAGIVADTEYLESLGESPVQRFEGFVEETGFLGGDLNSIARLEPVREYANYQWVCERLHGRNWALVGDAAGFVDPVFSSGLYLGMQGGRRLAARLLENGFAGLDDYQDFMLSTYANWRRVITDFYNGRLLSLFKMGKEITDGSIEDAISEDLRCDIGKIFTGLAGDSEECYRNLELVIDSAISDSDAREFRFRSGDSSVSTR